MDGERLLNVSVSIYVSCTARIASWQNKNRYTAKVIWFNSLIASSIKCENKVNFLRCSSDCKCVYVYALCVCNFQLAHRARARSQALPLTLSHSFSLHKIRIRIKHKRGDKIKNTEILSELHKSFATWQFETEYHFCESERVRACVGVHKFIKIFVGDFKTFVQQYHTVCEWLSLCIVTSCVLLIPSVIASELVINTCCCFLFFFTLDHGENRKNFFWKPCTFV